MVYAREWPEPLGPHLHCSQLRTLNQVIRNVAVVLGTAGMSSTAQWGQLLLLILAICAFN